MDQKHPGITASSFPPSCSVILFRYNMYWDLLDLKKLCFFFPLEVQTKKEKEGGRNRVEGGREGGRGYLLAKMPSARLLLLKRVGEDQRHTHARTPTLCTSKNAGLSILQSPEEVL